MPGFIGGSSGGSSSNRVSYEEEFIDPVTKIRVSTPENLIDTDFEYGTQSTKWETIELINNTPSFFSKVGDSAVQDITSISTLAGSREITVTTLADHNLQAGVPISVTGTKLISTDGAFVISSVPTSRTFAYLSRDTQVATTNVEDLYTSINTGEFFQGSQINISNNEGITTNALATSTLLVKTSTPHLFGVKTPFYFFNLNSSILLNFDSTNTESVSFDASNSSTSRVFDGSNTSQSVAVNFSGSEAALSSLASVGSTVTAVDTTANTITVSHQPSNQNFVGLPVGTPLYYQFNSVDGFFSSNPNGVVFLKTAVSLGTSFSTFSMSSIPDGSVIALTSNITGQIQIADSSVTFAGNNLDPANQVSVTLSTGSEISFDGSNSQSQTYTVQSYSGASGIITFTQPTGWQLGQMILYTTTGTAASGLFNNTTYWVSSVNASGNQINITDSPSNVNVSFLLNLTGGTGVQTFRSISVSLDRDVIAIPGHGFEEADMVLYRFPPGGRFTATESHNYYFVERVFDATHITLSRTQGFILDGSTESRAAPSAAAIKIANPAAGDGAYWIKPAGSNTAYLTYCIFSLESGNWMQVMKLSSSTLLTNSVANAVANTTSSGSAVTFSPQWDGWTWNSDNQFSTLFTLSNNSNLSDLDSFSPLFYSLPFNDIMILSINDTSRRVGWRHNTTIPNMRSVTGITSASTYGDTWLFPNVTADQYSWVIRLQTVSGVSQFALPTPVAFGFKVLTDRANTYTNPGQFITGGYSTDRSGGSTGTGLSMIGIGTTGAPVASRWGGGIGFTFNSNSQFRAHGNFHGPSTTSGGASNRTFTGLSVFVR